MLWNPTNPPHAASLKILQTAALSLSVQIRPIGVWSPSDLDLALAPASADGAGAFMLLEDPATFPHRRRIIEFAARHRLPPVVSENSAGRDPVAGYGLNHGTIGP